MRKNEPSEIREDMDFVRDLVKKQRQHAEPSRTQYVMEALAGLGYKPEFHPESNSVTFSYNGNTITVWPYKGWFSGKGVKDGRGIRKLLNQIK